jgi:hypothetical protein
VLVNIKCSGSQLLELILTNGPVSGATPHPGDFAERPEHTLSLRHILAKNLEWLSGREIEGDGIVPVRVASCSSE